MSYFWLDVWQQLTRQVCKCKHTKRHHIKLKQPDRSDVQCLDLVFEGGAFGDHGNLHCCQCLSYNQKESPFRHWHYLLQRSIIGSPKLPDVEFTLNNTFCICGHTVGKHGIGRSLNPLYPPCEVYGCKCKEYDYVNNPKIATNKMENLS